jgi:glycosyltransferase involved in cell wall biosynthesis
MKITLIGPAYPYRGGVSQHTTLLGHYLRRFHEVDFISFKKQYPKLLFPGKTDKDPSRSAEREPCVYLLNPLDPASWNAVVHRVLDFNPRVVVLIWWVPFFAPAWWFIVRKVRARTDIRVVFVCHNVLPHEKNILTERITRAVMALPDGFTVHSEFDEKQLLQLRPEASICRCPIAPHPRAVSSGEGREESRRILRIGRHLAVFLFFGFVRPYKGLDLLLQAMAKVVRARPNALLFVVGEFWEPIDKYRRMTKRLGLDRHVTFVSRYVPNEEVAIYFSACDTVVLPYRSATQSGVPQMAISMGRPVIVTDVGGLAENVTHSNMGWVVPPGDTNALAEAMITSIEPRQKRKLNSKIGTQNDFPPAWKAIVNAIEKLSIRRAAH